MNREEALERVRAILVEQLGVDENEVTEEASFQEDLDADSLEDFLARSCHVTSLGGWIRKARGC